MVRTVIRHVVSPPVDLSLSTNVVREKKDDVSPADMLVMLHDQEKEIGLKPAMEGESDNSHPFAGRRLNKFPRTAIDLCFGLTDLFPSEVFAVFMQRIIDGTTLPTLFMRTVRSLPLHEKPHADLFTPHRSSERYPPINRSLASSRRPSFPGSSPRRSGRIRSYGRALCTAPRSLHPQALARCCSSPRTNSGTCSRTSRRSKRLCGNLLSSKQVRPR